MFATHFCCIVSNLSSHRYCMYERLFFELSSTAFAERNPERNTKLVVCGDFNGGRECGAVRYLEDGFVDEEFREDGDPVVSSTKTLPLENPMTDVMSLPVEPSSSMESGITEDVVAQAREPPATLVVPELISLICLKSGGTAYENPTLSDDVVERLSRIYDRFATHETSRGDGSGVGGSTAGGIATSSSQVKRVMNAKDVERWLVAINKQLGRGSEFREAARQMGWKGKNSGGGSDSDNETRKDNITLPRGGLLSLDGFLEVYQAELRGGKFWGIAYDLAVLGEPLPTDAGVFQGRYDRMYCSSAVQPVAIMDFPCREACPNGSEPSDHLPVAAAFR